ncbi:DUF6268 family outer membrane beta-barrel protein [Cesiribacter sp. SM1]|uniref:DUF6268 family outer membrane beta-barrel protein n=1 Tax=Cesiribacter sp. SM1 TaxID=2861196 RepID=UPI001CD5842E|nr:DUF6268 family outer membrane beta-barrel protein [Cesiribacter sp. SM1]
MKKILMLLILATVYSDVSAQITFKTEYFGTSAYRQSVGDGSEKVGNSQGAAVVYQGKANLPLSMKMDEIGQPTVWGVGIAGAYVTLSNRNFTEDLVLDEMLNLGLSVYHVKPLNDKWSLFASLGGGIYSSGKQLSEISLKNALGSAAIVFIKKVKPHLSLGGGVAFNNSFGYPMALPAIYLQWGRGGRYAVDVSVVDGVDVSLKYLINKHLSLNYIVGVDGQLAIVGQDEAEKIFTHQYIVTGLQPEVKIGKKWSIPLTAGINAMRTAQLSERKLKSLFSSKYYYFQLSSYFSVGINYKLTSSQK